MSQMMPDHRWRLQLAFEYRVTDILSRWESSEKHECLKLSYDKTLQSLVEEYQVLAK